MRRLARAAFVIARRDYAATVLSRTFILFLIGPLLPILFGGLFGTFASGDDGAPKLRPILVAADPAEARAIRDARAHIAKRLGDDWMPPLRTDSGRGQPEDVILFGGRTHPLLTGPRDALDHLRGPMTLLLEEARAPHAAPVTLATRAIGPPPSMDGDARKGLARGAQLTLFVLMMILAGMLISNLVEEKSSKVIEVLAAAVPIDAVFLGKLLGMLAVSLTGILVWGATAGIGAWAFLPHAAIPAPAVGWPAFAALAIVYFMTLYLVLGALYLGIGAQASTVREVQTLSLPLTLAQLLFFGLASTVVARPDGVPALAAAVVPWSSPFAMLARAAERPALWPHPIAIAWQLLCVAAIVWVGARLFRLTVLRSGRLRLPRL
jgi:ABC-2 type transport system permease protein